MEAGPRTIWLFPWMQRCLLGGVRTLLAGTTTLHPLFNMFVYSRPPHHPPWAPTLCFPTAHTHPAWRVHLSLLNGCICSSSKSLQPYRMRFHTSDKSGSWSLHHCMSQAFTGGPCSISIIKMTCNGMGTEQTDSESSIRLKASSCAFWFPGM